MTYRETIEDLIKLLELAKLADSESAQEWQHPYDADSYAQYSFYTYIHAALVSITGGEFVDRYHNTGELDFDYAVANCELRLIGQVT